jgi:hypothetical protein
MNLIHALFCCLSYFIFYQQQNIFQLQEKSFSKFTAFTAEESVRKKNIGRTKEFRSTYILQKKLLYLLRK